jgi:hypothetical protein
VFQHLEEWSKEVEETTPLKEGKRKKPEKSIVEPISTSTDPDLAED